MGAVYQLLPFPDPARPYRGVGMGAVYQLASAPCCKKTIETAGFAIGSGANAKLLGFNVVGVVVAWALALVTLLENPLGALLTQVRMPQGRFPAELAELVAAVCPANRAICCVRVWGSAAARAAPRP